MKWSIVFIVLISFISFAIATDFIISNLDLGQKTKNDLISLGITNYQVIDKIDDIYYSRCLYNGMEIIGCVYFDRSLTEQQAIESLNNWEKQRMEAYANNKKNLTSIMTENITVYERQIK